MDITSLKPFHGYQSSIVPFSEGHFLYLASWDRSPTEFSSLTNVWVVTPEDKRMLFADPPATSDIVLIYHDFHEIHPAAITLNWLSNDHLQVDCASLDGQHELQIDWYLKETLGAQLLIALAAGPPTPFKVSRGMVALTNFLVDLFITRGGSTIIGQTETGQTFYVGAAEWVMQIKKGFATMDGRDLGQVSGPTWPVQFGDSVPSVQPVLKLGTFYLPYEKEMIAAKKRRLSSPKGIKHG